MNQCRVAFKCDFFHHCKSFLFVPFIDCIFSSQVFFGRPMLWGLTYDGEKGASEILELMRREIDLAFALTGKSKRNFYHLSIYGLMFLL